MQLSLLQIPSIFYVFYCCTFELEVLNTYKFYSIQIFFLDFYFTNVQDSKAAETLNKLSSIILQGKKTPKTTKPFKCFLNTVHTYQGH